MSTLAHELHGIPCRLLLEQNRAHIRRRGYPIFVAGSPRRSMRAVDRSHVEDHQGSGHPAVAFNSARISRASRAQWCSGRPSLRGFQLRDASDGREGVSRSPAMPSTKCTWNHEKYYGHDKGAFCIVDDEILALSGLSSTLLISQLLRLPVRDPSFTASGGASRKCWPGDKAATKSTATSSPQGRIRSTDRSAKKDAGVDADDLPAAGAHDAEMNRISMDEDRVAARRRKK